MMNLKSPRTLLVVNLVVGSLLGLLAIRGLASLSASDDQAAVSITGAEPVVFDSENDWTSARITLRNNGGRRMVVKVTEPDCDCSLKANRISIAPHQEQVFEFEIGSGSIRYSKTLAVDLLTNDPKNPRLPVTLQVLGSQEQTLELPTGAKSVLVSVSE